MLLTLKSRALSGLLTTVVSSYSIPSDCPLMTLRPHLFLLSSVGGGVRVSGRRESELRSLGSGRSEGETTTSGLFHRGESLLLLRSSVGLLSVGRVTVSVGGSDVMMSVDGRRVSG